MRERRFYVYDAAVKKVVPIEQALLIREKGSKLTKFQYQANELCHDVLKPDIRDLVKRGEINPVPGAKLFGYSVQDIVEGRV